MSSGFNLLDSTLHLAIKYLTLYLGQAEISRNNFQLLGVTCLLIASKIE